MIDRVFRAVRSLGPIDIRNVWRDGMLLMLLVLPPLLALIMRFSIPPLTEFLQTNLAFDLTPYYPLLMSSLVQTAPGITGVIVGFLLLDERDDGTMAALMVTPLSAMGYLSYRIFIPLVLGFVMTMVSYPLVGITPLPWFDLAAIALIGTMTAPITALALAAFADNKVTGLAVQKVLNAIGILPTLAFFVPMPLQMFAGVLPTYWPMKMTWNAGIGEAYWPYAIAGLIVNALFLIWLSRRFLNRTRS